MYGVWSLTTKSWVYESDGRYRWDCIYPTKKAAREDMRDFAVEIGDYEVRPISVINIREEM